MQKKALKRGVFITFEGVEGCGKSTHARLAYESLKRMGYPCVFTREPGGTRIGEKIRGILLSTDHARLSDTAELFLFEASRAQIVDQVIRPALKERKIVICDRFYDATTAYQGHANRWDIKTIKRLNRQATGGLDPDLTIILDLSVRKGLKRVERRSRKDRMEKKALSYHDRVRSGYRDIARSQPHRVKLIKTRTDLSLTRALIIKEVLDVIKKY